MNKEIDSLCGQILKSNPSSEVTLLIECAQTLNSIESDASRKRHLMEWAKYLLEVFGYSVTKPNPSKK